MGEIWKMHTKFAYKFHWQNFVVETETVLCPEYHV